MLIDKLNRKRVFASEQAESDWAKMRKHSIGCSVESHGKSLLLFWEYKSVKILIKPLFHVEHFRTLNMNIIYQYFSLFNAFFYY